MGTYNRREPTNETIMNTIILSCLLAVAFSQEVAQEVAQEVVEVADAALRTSDPIFIPAVPVPVAILKQEYAPAEDGSFTQEFEAEDGTSVSATGSVGSAGQVNIQGSYTFTLADGTLAVVTYLANEAGYTAQSDLLPVAPEKLHPDPPHVVELLRIAAEQREQGVQFDAQGFRI